MSEQPKITLVQKKIIYSILYGKYNILSITFARIHTCGIKSEYWLYSGLEGALIYCINAEPKKRTCHFLMFDLKTFETTFEFELYKKFDKAFKKGTERFFYFEVNNGFIGFEIPDMNQGQILSAQIDNFKDDYIKKKLKEYNPLKGEEFLKKSKKMIHLMDKRFKKENIQNKILRPEITLTAGKLEKEIITVQLDEKKGKIIIKGTGYQGIEKEMLKINGIDFELQNDLKVGNNESFTRYFSRNILRSFMKGLIIPKRKINRGAGVKVEKHNIEEEKNTTEEKHEEENPQNEIKEEETHEEEINEEKEKEEEKQEEIAVTPQPKPQKKKTPPKPKKRPSPPKPKKVERSPSPPPQQEETQTQPQVVVVSSSGGPPPPPPPPPPHPPTKNIINFFGSCKDTI